MTARNYLARAADVIREVSETQAGAIEQAGAAVAGALAAGGRLWAFGTGHSGLLAEELYNRAGGLSGVRRIPEPELALREGIPTTPVLERLPGLAGALIEATDLAAGDVVIVASNSGRNAASVEFAEQARERGATVIGVTSLQHSRSVSSRAPSGRRLFEVADIVVDNCGVPGDAVLGIDGSPAPVGATSTVAGALIVQAIVCEAVSRMVASGVQPPVLVSANVGEQPDRP